MTLALLDQERKLVEGMRIFANMRRIISACKVEQMFRRYKYSELREETERQRVRLKKFQQILRGWLERIVTGEAGRKEVADEIAYSLRGIPAHVELVGEERMDRKSKVPIVTRRVAYFYDVLGKDAVGTVRAGCLMAVALILDEGRGLTSRLQQCGWCGRFNLDLDAKWRPRRFCNAEHKRRFDLEDPEKGIKARMKKYRSKTLRGSSRRTQVDDSPLGRGRVSSTA